MTKIPMVHRPNKAEDMQDELLRLLRECAVPFECEPVMKNVVLSVVRSLDGHPNVLLRIDCNRARYITTDAVMYEKLERLRELLLARGHAFEQYGAIAAWLSVTDVGAPQTESCGCTLGNFVHFSVRRTN